MPFRGKKSCASLNIFSGEVVSFACIIQSLIVKPTSPAKLICRRCKGTKNGIRVQRQSGNVQNHRFYYIYWTLNVKRRYKLVLITLLSAQVMCGQFNFASSLTACYAFNGNGTEPVNNLTATLSGVSATVDRGGNNYRALAFSGQANSFVKLPNSSLLKPADAITVSGWFRFTYLGEMTMISARGNNTGFLMAYGLKLQTGFIGYFLRVIKQNGTISDYADVQMPLLADTWYHLAFSMNDSLIKVYVNGSLKKTVPATVSNFNYDSNSGVIVGGTNDPQSNKPFAGMIDNLRFYNRVLTDNEISALQILDPVCVNNGLAPVAAFSVSALQVCSGSTVSLNDQSSNFPTAWKWSFPGAKTADSTKPAPTYTVGKAGTYTVNLIASNINGSSAGHATINVLPVPGVTASSTKTLYCKYENCSLFASGATSYTWSTGQTGSVIVTLPLVQTVFTVTGKNSNGCTDTASIKIRVTTCQVPPPVGIGEQYSGSIVVYPNPATGYVKICTPGSFDGKALLFNATGHIVHEAYLDGESSFMDLTGLPAGIYFIVITDGLESRRVTIVKE